jgi:hypothetical protein
MPQTVIDPQSPIPAPAHENPSPVYDVSAASAHAPQPNKSNRLSIAALVSAFVGIGLATIPLIVIGVSTGLALGLVGVGLVLGVVASVLGVMGRSRADSAVLGMAGLVVGILALAWTIGGVACTIW